MEWNEIRWTVLEQIRIEKIYIFMIFMAIFLLWWFLKTLRWQHSVFWYFSMFVILSTTLSQLIHLKQRREKKKNALELIQYYSIFQRDQKSIIRIEKHNAAQKRPDVCVEQSCRRRKIILLLFSNNKVYIFLSFSSCSMSSPLFVHTPRTQLRKGQILAFWILVHISARLANKYRNRENSALWQQKY